MTDPSDQVMELIFGRWRSQTVYTGVELGVFEAVEQRPKHAVEIADQLDLDEENGYRLLRALSSVGLLTEAPDRRFALTDAGELLQRDHPESLRGITLLEEGPTHYAIWKHLGAIVRQGSPNGFEREFGHGFLEHREVDPDYSETFNTAMSSLSQMESGMVAELLDGFDFGAFNRVCDVGGGQGHLICTLVENVPEIDGIVLELPEVVEADEPHWHERLGLTERVEFVAGDFFEEVPTADAYLMKHILHDWPDDECVEILATIRDAAPTGARLFNCEFVVPEPDEPHLSKLYDLHMMVATGGRERTEAEYAELFESADFELDTTHRDAEVPMGVVEARAV